MRRTQNNNARPCAGRNCMKQIRFLTAMACLAAFLGSVTFAPAAESCCDKAKAAGKQCEHKCCVKAAKDKKVCEKCNPKKEDKK